MKKVFSVALAALLVVSALIFPLISALAVNTVTWDAYPEWKNQYQVRGYVEVFSYTGNTPEATIDGDTNIGESIYAFVGGNGSARSNYKNCDLHGTLPLLSWWYAQCSQADHN
ncbi:MAG: hypothetical protein IJL30_00645 [Clostridia bacterium]|nr:hypothetical protein [Clostridia bacterium]